MPKLTETDKKIIDNIISLVDWDQVIKFYKILNRKIGQENLKIMGIPKMSKTAKITTELAINEVRKVIEFVIENDLPELTYGPWLIMWENGEWESIDLLHSSLEDDEKSEEIEMSIPVMESRLQLLFVSQSVTAKEDIDLELNDFEMDGGLVLEDKLKESIEEEDYVLAGKLKDVIDELNKKRKK